MTRLSAWLAHLEALHPLGAAGIELGLERVRQVQAQLGQRQSVPLITVAGTNGKGSTCALLDAILGQAGYRVGLYSSPHLLRFNERVRVAGRSIGDAALCAAFARVEAARQAAGGTALTYFEFGTLAAWECFTAAGVDVIILEVGLGGRLDAVNCYDADCAVITSIDLDHCDYLGQTRESIGYEKAGILRAGRPLVCADPAPPASVLDSAAAGGAQLKTLGRAFGFTPQGSRWQYWSAAGARLELPLPALPGAHQLGNAAAALCALESLGERLPLTLLDIENGLTRVSLPGRFDLRPGPVEVLLDVAHNPQAARALAASLRQQPCRGATWAVFGMLRDKDIKAVVAAMGDVVNHWLPCTLPGPRAASADELAAILVEQGLAAPVQGYASAARAFRAARKAANEGDRILAFGSFLTVAAVLRQLARKA